MIPVHAKQIEDWTARAVEACRAKEPELRALGICYVCMCNFPCLCERAEPQCQPEVRTRLVVDSSAWTGMS